MQDKHGTGQWNFLPETYVLPDQYGDFVQWFKKYRKEYNDKNNYWIVKPSNMSRGRGIYIIDDISEVGIDDELTIV